MKSRARRAKSKNTTDITKPSRRPTSAYVKQLMAKYHADIVAPLVARVVLLEQIIADNSEVQGDRIVFKTPTTQP